jgi:peptidoglycan/LPS O-acetylase OafA/YrhL
MSTPRERMGYQPALDGLRAVSVIAVVLYHAGFGWMHGGFLGVEVFFVISGYLITTLLIEERRRTGGIALATFWVRRARRLLPALLTMLLVVATWVAFVGSAEQLTSMRRDLPWALSYLANWGQIVGDVPYFSPADPPLLRHLWSLAVEEQWYLLWPLAFLLLTRHVRTMRARARVLLGAATVAVATMWWIQRGGATPLEGIGGWLSGADRVNVNYLSTVTRSSGLLLGAAAAFVWRPWWSQRRDDPERRVSQRALDLAAGLALGVLVCAFTAARLTAGYMYPWVLLLASAASLVVVGAAVHPRARGTRALLAWDPLVEIGRRSYGLYLWHWPVFVVVGATDGSVPRFVTALVLSVALSEACYRYVEIPVREGRLPAALDRPRERLTTAMAVAVVVVGLAGHYAAVRPYDVAAGGRAAQFRLASASIGVPVSPALPAPAAPSGSSTPTAAPTPAAAPAAAAPVGTPAPATPELPVDVSVVGDSQAHSLAINLPDGIESTFRIRDFSLDGCGVHDAGSVLTARSGFSSSFERCRGWRDTWADAAVDADVVLVVIGAWDVFDLDVDGTTYRFGTPAFDDLFASHLRSGLDAIAAGGATAALLEVPCMRPQDVDGAGVPALPERGDDARVAHLNELLRAVAAADPTRAAVVEGPDAWCADEAIATDLGYRWDGVHVYRPGAALVYETIAADLLRLAS